ncbi:hypothetical protein Tco_0365771 [Tanacetum coccineum]
MRFHDVLWLGEPTVYSFELGTGMEDTQILLVYGSKGTKDEMARILAGQVTRLAAMRYRFNDKQISDLDVNGSSSDDKKISQIQDYAYYMPQRSLPGADNELLIPSVNNEHLNDLDVDDSHSDIDKTRQSKIEVEQQPRVFFFQFVLTSNRRNVKSRILDNASGSIDVDVALKS